MFFDRELVLASCVWRVGLCELDLASWAWPVGLGELCCAKRALLNCASLRGLLQGFAGCALRVVLCGLCFGSCALREHGFLQWFLPFFIF